MTVDELGKRAAILAIAAKHGVQSVRVFGSFARGDARADSDLDLLIEAGPHTPPWFPGGLLIDLEEELGRRVDIDPAALLQALQADLVAMFEGDVGSLAFGEGDGPTVWLFVGVNGVGKTTTIGKLALRETQAGRTRRARRPGDTFRAAAGEQLESWARVLPAWIVRGSDGADPSSVIFDAVHTQPPEALDKGHGPEDHRHVGGDARVDPRRRALEPEAAVQVVAYARDDEDHEQRDKGPVHEEGQERQLEHVEADRLVELGVHRPEGLAAAEQEPVLPLVARRRPDDEGKDDGHDRTQREGVPADDLLIAADDLELRRDEQGPRGDAVDDPEAHPAGDEERAYEHCGKFELGLDQQAPNRREAGPSGTRGSSCRSSPVPG